MALVKTGLAMANSSLPAIATLSFGEMGDGWARYDGFKAVERLIRRSEQDEEKFVIVCANFLSFI
jgi:hypothetical protein